jgi:hypothetical protein
VAKKKKEKASNGGIMIAQNTHKSNEMKLEAKSQQTNGHAVDAYVKSISTPTHWPNNSFILE